MVEQQDHGPGDVMFKTTASNRPHQASNAFQLLLQHRLAASIWEACATLDMVIKLHAEMFRVSLKDIEISTFLNTMHKKIYLSL